MKRNLYRIAFGLSYAFFGLVLIAVGIIGSVLTQLIPNGLYFNEFYYFSLIGLICFILSSVCTYKVNKNYLKFFFATLLYVVIYLLSYFFESSSNQILMGMSEGLEYAAYILFFYGIFLMFFGFKEEIEKTNLQNIVEEYKRLFLVFIIIYAVDMIVQLLYKVDLFYKNYFFSMVLRYFFYALEMSCVGIEIAFIAKGKKLIKQVNDVELLEEKEAK